MEWTMLGFYSVNFLASMGAYLFLSGGSDLEPELSASEEFDLTFPTLQLGSIAQSIVSNDLYTAQHTWDEVTKDVSLNHSHTFKSLSCIISRIESTFVQEAEITCRNRIPVTLLKLIRYSTSQVSFPLFYKAKLHASVLQMLKFIFKSNNTIDSPRYHEGVYTVTKSAADQKLEYVNFSKTSNLTENTSLSQMIPLQYWLLVTQRNVLIQNVKYNSYLYVGRERANSPFQVFLWNLNLTNRNQAAFRLQSQDESVSCEATFLNFLMYQPQMNRLVMSHCCLKNHSREHRNEDVLLLARPFSERDTQFCELQWEVQFISSNGHFRLTVHNSCQSGILKANPPNTKLTARSSVELLHLDPANNQLSDDSVWQLIVY